MCLLEMLKALQPSTVLRVQSPRSEDMKLVRVRGALNGKPYVRPDRLAECSALILLGFNGILTANLLHLREMGVYHTATAA
jgi:hypothetical protein